MSVDPQAFCKGLSSYNQCRECGTIWRVWMDSGIAAATIEWTDYHRRLHPQFQRAPVLDIDRIILAVRKAIPAIDVYQLDPLYAGDGDGLWNFRIPDKKQDIQVESWTGSCPFLVEHDDMKATADAITATSVEQAVAEIIRYHQH